MVLFLQLQYSVLLFVHPCHHFFVASFYTSSHIDESLQRRKKRNDGECGRMYFLFICYESDHTRIIDRCNVLIDRYANSRRIEKSLFSTRLRGFECLCRLFIARGKILCCVNQHQKNLRRNLYGTCGVKNASTCGNTTVNCCLSL